MDSTVDDGECIGQHDCGSCWPRRDSLGDTAVPAKAGAEMGTARIVDPRLLVWLSGKKEGCEQFDRGVRGDVD